MSWYTKWSLSNDGNVSRETMQNCSLIGVVGDDGNVTIVKDKVSGEPYQKDRVVSLKTFLYMTEGCQVPWFQGLWGEYHVKF